jgi:hypothetical protein
MLDLTRAAFLRDQLYPLQWQTNCSNVMSQILSNSGFSANVGLNSKSFISANRHNETFVNVKKDLDRFWRYTDWPNGSHVCPSVDMDCYFLPLSNCKGNLGQKDDMHGEKSFNVNGGRNTWIRVYMLRPQQWIRKRIYNLRKTLAPIQLPCTVMHVRRTDAVLEQNWRKNRNYFPLSDYVERVPSNHKSIILLTDDQSAIDEAHEFYSNRTWIYINRTRHRGTQGGYNGHIPSGNPIHEVTVILAEMQLAANCQHLVHTKSGFRELLLQQMQIKHGSKNIVVSKIDWGRQPNSTHHQTDEEFFQSLKGLGNRTS